LEKRQAEPIVLVRLAKVRDVLDLVNSADCARDGQSGVQLNVELGRHLGRHPWRCCANRQAQNGKESNKFCESCLHNTRIVADQLASNRMANAFLARLAGSGFS
jgi:hypothetical protein